MYFALLARRRMDLYGATAEDFAQVKVKNARHGLQNPNARYRKEVSLADVLASPVVADPLRLLDICATSDGAAALVVASAKFTREHLGSLRGVPAVRAVSTVTPRYPQHLPELPDIATDSTAVVPAPQRVFKDQIVDAAYAEAGIGPKT
ncbi:putative acetyl-CoA C-acyltransferase [Mycobacterium xenopi 3993]|nr:putative acetyl-CoA C-acyltransferase [Mycobacterium xenopi 3993]